MDMLNDVAWRAIRHSPAVANPLPDTGESPRQPARPEDADSEDHENAACRGEDLPHGPRNLGNLKFQNKP